MINGDSCGQSDLYSTDWNRECNGGAQRPVAVVKSMKHRFQMPKLYSDILKGMVLANKNVNRTEARCKMIQALGWGVK